jgi:hypothetical protein
MGMTRCRRLARHIGKRGAGRFHALEKKLDSERTKTFAVVAVIEGFEAA